MGSTWQPIETFDLDDYVLVDLWLNVPASPRSFGFADSFRAVDTYRANGKWFDVKGELYSPYITHWMPIPNPPSSKKEVYETHPTQKEKEETL